MKTLAALLFLSALAHAGPLKKADLDPTVQEPRIPGSEIPLERMNTAPTEPEVLPEDKEFRDVLEARKQKEEELEEKLPTKEKK